MDMMELRRRGEYFTAYRIVNLAVTLSIAFIALDLLQWKTGHEPSGLMLSGILIVAIFLGDRYPFKPIKTPKPAEGHGNELKASFAYALLLLLCIGVPFLICQHLFTKKNSLIEIWLTAAIALAAELVLYRCSATVRRWTGIARDQ